MADANPTSSLPASIFERIRLTNQGYYIGEQNGKGVTTPDGILLETKIISGAYTVTLTGLDSDGKASVGDTLTVTGIEKNGSSIDLTTYAYTISITFEDMGYKITAQETFTKNN